MTIIKNESPTDRGGVDTLYYIGVGELDEAIYYRDSKYEASSITLQNDVLHRQIRETCESSIYAKLSDTVRQKFQAEQTYFIVSEEKPNWQPEKNAFDLASIVPELSQLEEKTCCSFSHSTNGKLCFRILEPASPVELQIRLGNGKELKTFVKTDEVEVCKVYIMDVILSLRL